MKDLTKERRLFFELLQVAMDNRERLSVDPTQEQWSQLIEIANEHSLTGVAYNAILKLKKLGYVFAKGFLLNLVGNVEIILEKNAELDKDCRVLTKKFSEGGFDTCILKGQGIKLLYGKDIERTPGDVDIWVCPKERVASLQERRLKVHAYCVSLVGEQHTVYHHMEFPARKNQVEVHFTPSWMYSPFANKRLQRFFDDQWDRRVICEKGFYVPSLEFNLVYILVHIFRHLIDEGVGLRQLLDYYHVLAEAHNEGYDQREQSLGIIRSLGLNKFTAAIMYILKEVFAMPDEYLLCKPNEKLGQFILDEIMLGGSFGYLDNRYGKKSEEEDKNVGIHNLWVQIRHNMKFLRYFPGEILWNVPFRIWHYFWRKSLGWR